MCLVVRKSKINYDDFKMAEKDIIIYKVLRIEKGKYRSLFKVDNFYKKNKINEEILLKDIIPVEYWWMKTRETELQKGYHSYINKEDAFSSSRAIVEPVCEFIIPKGSYYIEGNYGYSDIKNFISTNIIFKKDLTSTFFQRIKIFITKLYYLCA